MIDAVGDMELVRDEGDLVWAAWGDEYSVYCQRTGETHLIGELPAEVLRSIGEIPVRLERLSKDLAVRCDVANDRAWRDKIAGIVDDLCRLEMLRQIT